MSTFSLPDEKPIPLAKPAKSMESLYSSSSSKYSTGAAYKNKLYIGRQAKKSTPAAAPTEFRQRVLSARKLRIKSVQNKLNDAELHIGQLAQENRILRTLHKRQDSALAKYQNTNAELPQLLNSHAEEIRVWQTKFRNLQHQNKELTFKLKQKDQVILSLTDQNKHLTQLNKDKHLEDRERLQVKLNSLENKLSEKDENIKTMTRQFLSESRSYKKLLQNEHQRYKDAMVKLERIRIDGSDYPKLDEVLLSDKMAKTSLNSKSAKNKIKTDFLKSPHVTINEEPSLLNSDTKLAKSEAEFASKIQPVMMKPRIRPVVSTKPFAKSLVKTSDAFESAIKRGMAALGEEADYGSGDLDSNPDSEPEGINKVDSENFIFSDKAESDDNEIDVIDSADAMTQAKDNIDSITMKMNDLKERDNYLNNLNNLNDEQATDCFKDRANIDPKKKTKLLAALRAIDDKDSN